RPACVMHARSVSTFSATASDPTISRRTASGISGPARRRRVSLGSSRGSAQSCAGAIKTPGGQCARMSTRAGRLGALFQLWDLYVGLLRDRPPCGDARAALPGRASPGLLARDQMLRGCDHLWGAWRSSATQTPTPRETIVVGLEMKPVGEPYAGNPH